MSPAQLIYFKPIHFVNPVTNNVSLSFHLPESLEKYLGSNVNKCIVIYDLDFVIY